MQITAKMVKELREATNVGMMECKRALQEAEGSMEKAVQLLRERGIAIAGKKASRTAKQGLIIADVIDDGKKAVMVEVNCETDFVARNENFKAFVDEMFEKAKNTEDGKLAEDASAEVTAKITEIGENLILRRNISYTLSGTGALATYVHLGGKVGVMLEVACEKEETTNAPVFVELIKDLTLHIAAVNPQFLSEDDVSAEALEAERAIYKKQVEDKPANIVDKIVDGKIRKYLSQICLVDQEFVKDGDFTIKKLLVAKGKELGDTLCIKRFVRYQLGA
ncbi:MAG: elongation factor Ts [Spartobacteria bacterium]|nr:elongation factor Ts [Spartobacteria bacterium]